MIGHDLQDDQLAGKLQFKDSNETAQTENVDNKVDYLQDQLFADEAHNFVSLQSFVYLVTNFI